VEGDDQPSSHVLIIRLLKDLFATGKHPMNDEQQPSNHDASEDAGGYAFTTDWTSPWIPAWTHAISLMPEIGKMLEVGSYEGRSTVWLIEHAFKTSGMREIYCVDTWKGGIEHQRIDMSAVEERFLRNVAIAKSRTSSEITVHPLKGDSCERLASLIAEGHGQSFDLIYIDGSHQCPDVLRDIVLCFELCKIGGLMICDDYLWSLEQHGSEDLLNQPKLAIDSFFNCYRRKLEPLVPTGNQMYIQKTSA
jgi:predicted O-methyltransferase YrrM